jgi:hypothetical protein
VLVAYWFLVMQLSRMLPDGRALVNESPSILSTVISQRLLDFVGPLIEAGADPCAMLGNEAETSRNALMIAVESLTCAEVPVLSFIIYSASTYSCTGACLALLIGEKAAYSLCVCTHARALQRENKKHTASR